MNPEVFAEWMRRQGHRVYRTTSSYWYEAGPRVLQAFPYHWMITPSKNEISNLMQEHGIVALRYSTPINFREGKASYHVILRQPYHMDMLKSQARNGIKRGLSHFSVEQIPFERLATEGWLLQQDTLARQDRLRSMTQVEWERLCRAADDLPGFEAWAGIDHGELAGALIICRIDDMFNVPFAVSHSRFLCNHVNNAVFYSASCNMLEREGVSGIFYTVQSLDAPADVDEFKFRMGFKPRAVRQCVDFHPSLSRFATPTTHRYIKKMLQRDPSNPLLAKAEGMLRFHVEGNRILAEQPWPECCERRRFPRTGSQAQSTSGLQAQSMSGLQVRSGTGLRAE
jgi:hypothetical protein